MSAPFPAQETVAAQMWEREKPLLPQDLVEAYQRYANSQAGTAKGLSEKWEDYVTYTDEVLHTLVPSERDDTSKSSKHLTDEEKAKNWADRCVGFMNSPSGYQCTWAREAFTQLFDTGWMPFSVDEIWRKRPSHWEPTSSSSS
ncbi:hypothetical protein I302_106551 [Kwoniella bestiolae CBS 10118]|uniref:Uncharacterized protein n=1 Tax=Kwoniella bestiolae CBS 10118 TaxID=1296100 RepID=A0A1B9G136_9TREE|nr:hypothetical protein I302_06187 [Kwoniella bestiolae CBS 10118]OCF24726.1 hypothetical protein I302_06187 [Kwoniella bestiolae CBS 10118]